MTKINLLKPKWSGTTVALRTWELFCKWHDVGRTLPINMKFMYNGKYEIYVQWQNSRTINS